MYTINIEYNNDIQHNIKICSLTPRSVSLTPPYNSSEK